MDEIVYIYADMVNGNSIIDVDDIGGLYVDDCQDINDVRYYLRHMGDGAGETFERVLKVSAGLIEAIDDEYGIKA